MKFKEMLRKNKGVAVILAGSYSDEGHIKKIINSLKEYSIPFEVRICSAHKQLNKISSLIEEYNNINSSIALIAIAGKTDALSGILSFNSVHPIISCPPDHFNLSCVENPSGSSNCYIGNPSNIGKFIAQMYSSLNNEYKNKIIELNKNKIKKLVDKDKEFKEKY